MHSMLQECTYSQRDLFRRMYNHLGKFARDVDALSDDRLDNAFDQIERTIAKNNK